MKTTTTVMPFETMEERFGPADPNLSHMSYGYMWWLIDDYLGNNAYNGASTTIGYGGQFITFISGRKMFIADKTKLNIPTMLGITYIAMEDPIYFTIVNKVNPGNALQE